MEFPPFVFIHKDHPLSIEGVNSGAEMATLWMARAIAKLGYRVVVCANIGCGDTKHEGVEFIDLGDSHNIMGAIERLSNTGSYYLVASCSGVPLLVCQNDLNCLAKVLIWHDPPTNAAGFSNKTLNHVADAVICVSHAQAELLSQHDVKRELLHTVHNGADLEVFQPGDPGKRDYSRLMFAGALVRDKGIIELIEAFTALKQHHSNLKLDVYGSASLWDREPLFNEQEIERNVPGIKFHGAVGQAELAKAYQTAGICVVPSIWFDPLNMIAVEAQVSGCPVVSFGVGGVKETYIPGETGVMIPEVSSQALAQNLHDLLSVPDRLRQMSERSPERSREHFTWNRAAKELIAIVEKSAGSLSPR